MALRDLLVRIRGDKSGLDSALKGAGVSVTNFNGLIKKLGTYIAAAFSVKAIADWVKEGVKAAMAAEGIKKAFEKIASPEVMGQLKKATRGLFDDAELAQFAVKAYNLGIPFENLAKYLEFATKRAITTGKSVNELAEAIILGIGRKSTRSLIQLGMSVQDLQKEMNKTGDFTKAVGNIIDTELVKMGDVADTTAVKVKRLAVVWEELKEAVGKKIIGSEFVQNVLEGFQILVNKWTAEKPSKYAGMSNEELLKTRGALLNNKNTLLDALGTEQGAVNKRDNWVDRLLGNYKSAKQTLSGTENEINQINKDLEEINALLAVKPPEGSMGDILLNTSATKITGLTPKVGKRTFDKETTAISDMWVKGQLGSNGLAPGPKLDKAKQAQQIAEEQMIEAQEKLDNYMQEVENTLQAGRQMAIDLGADFVEALGEAIGGGNMKDIGKGLLLSFANFLSTFGKMLITLGIGMKAFQESLKNLFANPLVPIVAGAALIATAGIIRGAAQKAANSVQGGGGSGGGYSPHSNSGPAKIELHGVLRGSDIYLSASRYSKELQTGT